jgi:hypothetical protein
MHGLALCPLCREPAEALIIPRQPSRFLKGERVVCRMGEYDWVPGGIALLDEDNPQDPTGRSKFPYIVKLDPPVGRMIAVPSDCNTVCRPEACFEEVEGVATFLTPACVPTRNVGRRRFAAGDLVACAVGDATGDFTVWAHGEVVDVNLKVDTRNVPYRVKLNTGTHVYVHRDVHWLVRDQALQPAGVRQAKDGTRDLKRMVKRPREAEWEIIDHETRKVRITSIDPDDSDSD